MDIEITIKITSGDGGHFKMKSDDKCAKPFLDKLLGFIRENYPVDYAEYINSLEWKEKAKTTKRRAGYRCEMCGAQFKKDKSGGCKELFAHHLTYERLGHERDGDLQALCKQCSDTIHGR